MFPALKKKGLYPIYIRLDHGDNASSLTDQIWLNLQRENLLAQSLVESRENYSLWEWCHDLKEGLLSERTSRAVPVFVDRFQNPLYLKTYSDALNRNNRQEERKAIEAMIRKLVELPDEHKQTSLPEK